MAAPTTAVSARPFTFEDLEGMPDDHYRREIIGGSLVVNPAPNVWHQRAVGKLLVTVEVARPAGLETLTPFDWRPAGGDVYEPDLLVVRSDDLTERGFLRPGSNPVLAVEVLSSNRIFDLVTKRAAYAAAGLPSYWIVDPLPGSLLALRLGPDGICAVEAGVSGDGVFTAGQPFPFLIAAADPGRR
jgi:Uma2 family endonuclease